MITMTDRIEHALALAALALATARNAVARGDIQQATALVDTTQQYLSDIESSDFPDPSPMWETLYESEEPMPDASDIAPDYRDFSPLTFPAYDPS